MKTVYKDSKGLLLTYGRLKFSTVIDNIFSGIGEISGSGGNKSRLASSSSHLLLGNAMVLEVGSQGSAHYPLNEPIMREQMIFSLFKICQNNRVVVL